MSERWESQLVGFHSLVWGKKKQQPKTQPTKPPSPVGGLCTQEAEKLVGLGSTDSSEVVGEYLAIPYLMKASAQ